MPDKTGIFLIDMKKSKHIIIIIIVSVFTVLKANAQEVGKIDPKKVLEKIGEAVENKDISLLQSIIYLLHNEETGLDEAYDYFVKANIAVITFDNLNESDFAPDMLIDSAAMFFNYALFYDDFKDFKNLSIQNPEMGVEWCIENYNARGRAYFEAGEISESIESYQKSLNLRPNYFAFLGAGLAYLKSINYPVAAQYLENAIEMEPSNMKAHISTIEAYIGSGEFTKAEVFANKAYNTFKDSTEFLKAFYNVSIAVQNNESSILALERFITLDSSDAQVFLNLGIIFEKVGDFNEAENSYLKGLKQFPNNFNLNYNLAALYYNKFVPIFQKRTTEDENLNEQEKSNLENLIVYWLKLAKPYLDICFDQQPKHSNVLKMLEVYNSVIVENVPE
ncbi:MAG: tetratricopeptide repeat protein [Bacteroidales bacterium]|jgi:tetratricopeptide (TPR) repeat protein|nr:tetratricopeptide repeat protein [Bacteroidales bacterium]